MSEQNKQPSKILIEEYLAAKDERFLSAIRRLDDSAWLGSFCLRWASDRRSWSRQQIISYLLGDQNLPGHEIVYKRLFKHFEQKRDHEMLAIFMVALDRLVRRVIGTRYVLTVDSYDYRKPFHEQYRHESYLRAPVNKTFKDQRNRKYSYTNYLGKQVTYPLPDLLNGKENRLFSNRTRNYLRRRVWRYFRFLSYRDPDSYVAAIKYGLAHYTDPDFAKGENILDNWSLMHACYFHSRAIQFSPEHTNLVAGQSVEDLSPAPYQPQLWQTTKANKILIDLLLEAKSGLVQSWAFELHKQNFGDALNQFSVEELFQLLQTNSPKLRQLVESAFPNHPALPTLTVEKWLDLLNAAGDEQLDLLTSCFRTHVTDSRLTSQQLIELTISRRGPLATLGFEFLQSETWKSKLTPNEIVELAACDCRFLGGDIATWALGQLEQQNAHSAENVIDFFDSQLRPVRRSANQWLTGDALQDSERTELWLKLLESPFPDVKSTLVEQLTQFQASRRAPNARTNSISAAELLPLCAAVILQIHSGGRSKLQAIREIANLVEHHPESIETAIPILAIALRSIRGPEMRTAMVSTLQILEMFPEQQERILSFMPEFEVVE